MSEYDNEFGKRRPAPLPAQPAARRTPEAGRGIPPLVKQIGGVALGAAIMLALAGVSDHTKKQMGKNLDRQWSERTTSLSSQPDIQIRDNEAMRSSIQTCDIGRSGACK